MKENLYQYIILAALIIYDGYILFTTGKLDQAITGALIGVMAGTKLNKE